MQEQVKQQDNNLVVLDVPVSSTEHSLSIEKIAKAICEMQTELEHAKKDSKGFNYNYSDLTGVIETAKPALNKHKLSVIQLVGQVDSNKNIGLTTLLLHDSGQYFRSYMNMPLVGMKGSNQAQEAGATISYMRRYAYQAIIGMASEDSDGVPDTKNVQDKSASNLKPNPPKEKMPDQVELDFWKNEITKAADPEEFKTTLCKIYYIETKNKLGLDRDVARSLAGSYAGIDNPRSLKDVFSSAKNLAKVCLSMMDEHSIELFEGLRKNK